MKRHTQNKDDRFRLTCLALAALGCVIAMGCLGVWFTDGYRWL